MTYEETTAILETEWEPDGGFFWKIRQGQFVQAEFERARMKIAAIAIPEGADVPRRLVSLLWYIPLFMSWQVERVQEAGGDVAAYRKAVTIMTNETERLLGVP